MMKRFVKALGTCLLLTLLVAAMCVMVNAEPMPEGTEATPLELDTPAGVTISSSDYVYFSFTPAETKVYVLRSQSTYADPYAYLYDAEGMQLDYCDDGLGSDFELDCQLEADQTYIYAVNSNYEDPFTVTLSADSEISSIDIEPIEVIKEYDGSWNEYWDEETEEWVRETFFYNWADHITGSVTFSDGTTAPIEDRWFTYPVDGEAYYVDAFDQQSYENPWTADNTYTTKVSVMGCPAQVSVSVITTPITEIDLEPLVMYKELDGFWTEDWIEETGEWDPWFCYNWTNRISGTVTFKDGTTVPLVEGYYFDFRGEMLCLDWEEEQSFENQWTPGIYTPTVTALNYIQPVTVTIEATPIADIQFDTITLIKEVDGWWYNSWDEETGEWLGSYYRYDWHFHITGTVYFKDGTTSPIEDLHVIYRDSMYGLDWSDEQSYENEWDVGAHTPEISVMNYTGNVTVNIEYELVTEIDIDPITVVSGIDGRMREDWNEETNDWTRWFYYGWTNNVAGTVTFKDGTTAPVVNGVFTYQGEEYGLNYRDNQAPYSPWEKDNTYIAEVYIKGCYAPVSVTVSAPQAEEIELDAEYRVQLSQDKPEIFYAFTPETDGNYVFYSFNNGYYNPYATLYNQNMVELTYSDDAGSLNFVISQALTAGETYYLKASAYFGSQYEYSIKVMSLDIQEFVLDPIVLKEGVHGYENSYMDETFTMYDWWNHLSGSVTFTNGTVCPISGTIVRYEGLNFPILGITQDQFDNHWLGGETYVATAEFLGKNYPVSVTIEECPFVGITFDPIVIKAYSNGYWEYSWASDQDYYTYDWQNLLTYTVQLKDGSTVSGTGRVFGYNGEDYYISGYFYQDYENRMEAGKTYSQTLSLLGMEAPVSITIANTSWFAGFEYMVYDGKAIICGSTRTDEVLTIPQTLNGYPVVAVENLGSAVLYAKEIVIGDSITKLGNELFYDAAVKKITVGKGITNYNWLGMLSATKLEQIVISSQNPAFKSVDGVVYDKNVTTLLFVPMGRTSQHTVPDTVTDVETFVNQAYIYENLNLTFGSGITDYVMIDGVIYDKDVSKLYYVNKNNTGSYTMPTTVTTIKEAAFANTNYSSITLSPKVTDLVYRTFAGCRNLRSVTLPENLASIGNSAFADCGSLQAIVIPAGVTNIQEAFVGAPLSHIFYKGTEEQWYNMERWFDTSYITVHCNATGNEMRLESEGNLLKMYCSICEDWTVISKPTEPLNITGQPLDQSAYSGETISVSVEAEGDGLTYQWYYKDKGASTFTVSDVKTNTYATAMNSGVNGRQLYCVITDQNGNTVTTDTATLRMRTQLKITKQPASAYVASGSTARVTVNATGEGLTYQWYYKDKGASTFSASDVKTNTYATTMNDGINGRQLYCVITDQYGISVTSNTVTIVKHSAHIYSNNCDPTCNLCYATRTAPHTFSNACDPTCNGCSTTRTVSGHKYSNSCDPTCNYCNAVRTAPHTFSNNCDSTCNGCKATRKVSGHKYSNNCDPTCNYCNAVRTAPHTFSNNCDPTCNKCTYKRTAPHTFSNACDPTCNKCTYKRTALHTFSNNCDPTCNKCTYKRTAPHTFSNNCDSTCNGCKATRKVSGHKYSNNCDPTCNYCNAVRTAPHTFSNNCDPTCNKCSHKRTAPHTFSNACDPTCNKCTFKRTPPHVYAKPTDTTCALCKQVTKKKSA